MRSQLQNDENVRVDNDDRWNDHARNCLNHAECLNTIKFFVISSKKFKAYSPYSFKVISCNIVVVCLISFFLPSKCEFKRIRFA